MKKYVPISDDEKWQAVVTCDKSYDGLFFYGVKTTGIFCRPSCTAKTPNRKNVVFFDNATNSIAEGFRPCKKCRPDKEIFEPDLELVEKAKDIFNMYYDKSLNLSLVSKQLGVSTNHLGRLFRQNYGITPMHYIIKLRIYKACELLEQEDMNILEVAYATGFKSISNFYRYFKDGTGHTPNEHRKRHIKFRRYQ